ncbi:hypothetical protein [Hyalangium versicolor]|uniref:hypothetical protein n=1 Tax=Hyalangium versicolor TaxID=2861190 RepID=UPI001CCA8AD4|nr:hypothetical protein [Hyalangium versicolor]
MSQDTAPRPKRGLKRPVEVVRAELLKDADTKRIAKAVGMELEAYVELVLQYAQDKDKEPVLDVATDEDLQANGFSTPSAEDVANFLIKGAKGELGVNQEFEKSGFENSKGPKGPSLAGSPTGEVPKGDPSLMDQVKKGRN